MPILAAIGFALTLSAAPAEPASNDPPWTGRAGRVFTSSAVHVGLRPAAVASNTGEFGLGATLQITCKVPW